MLPGFVYFVSIHTRPTVVRGPAGEVYRDVTEATGHPGAVYCTLGGKGLWLMLEDGKKDANFEMNKKPILIS